MANKGKKNFGNKKNKIAKFTSINVLLVFYAKIKITLQFAPDVYAVFCFFEGVDMC
jgi:hypothetical protein